MNPADSQWMAQALRLAELGLYTTSPNPRVGCVLVKNNKVIGEGWHVRAGEPHAEIHALRKAGKAAQDATAYVTLEPCSHHGRTPPCADALIAAGVSRVVAAMQDPNPLVAGQGLQKLRAAGIEVECGLMEAAARVLNIGFVSRMTRGTPWVRSKIAASLDGRTALNNGTSKWITGEAARRDVQHWRARSCVVLTGIGTVLADDPQLNVREIDGAVPTRWGEALGCGRNDQAAVHTSDVLTESQSAAVRQPLRVVLDSELRIPPKARILQGGQTLIYTASSDTAKHQELKAGGADVVTLAGTDGKVDMLSVMRDLAQRGINEVLVESGRKLNGALLQAGLVDELVLYLAPQLLGDAARGLADLGELTQLPQRVALQWNDVRQVGNDLRIVAKISKEK